MLHRPPLLERIYYRLLHAAGTAVMFFVRALGWLIVNPIVFILGHTLYRNVSLRRWTDPSPDTPKEKAP